MAWVDNGQGGWIWQPSINPTTRGYESTTPTSPMPSSPPPSGQVATPTGDPPDGWSGWQWDAGQKKWIIPDGQQPAHDQWVAQQNLQQSATTAQASQPTVQGAFAQGFDPTGAYGRMIANRQPGMIAGMATPTVDATQTDASRQERDAALADQRKVLESTLNLGIDPQEQLAFQQRAQEQGMLSANTLAANARGGPGAIAAARLQANQQMPAITGQAAQSAQQEELSAFNTRVAQANAAAGIASTIGQTATTGFSQEANLAQNNAQIGLQTIDRVLADSGQQIQADLQGQQQLGAMIQDVNQLGLDYSQLDVGVQQNIFDQLAGEWGIDEQIKGQLEAIAKQKQKGVMDYIMGLLGAGEGAAQTAGTLGFKPLGK